MKEKLHLKIYKSTGPDLLHPRILRTFEDSLSAPLTYILNSSAETGIIPVDWKYANEQQYTRKEADKNHETTGPLASPQCYAKPWRG